MSQPTLNLTYQHQLIGEPKMQLLQLKIKVNVVHVGHSQPQVPLKDYTQSKPQNYLHSPNNN